MALITLSVFLSAVLPASAIIDATLQMQLGNLTGATADTNNHSHFLIQRSVETIDYNDNRGAPNWASWDLTSADLGSSGRSPNFSTDTNLPANFHVIPGNTFTTNNGESYDRGHMCPSGDRTVNTNVNGLVFFMDNIVPQASAQNQGIWANLESYSRSILSGQELLISCGVYDYYPGPNQEDSGLVGIASNLFKVIVCVPTGTGTAYSRLTNANPASIRVIAVEIPNLGAEGSLSWSNFLTSTRQVQADSGYNFFTALPNNLGWVLRSKVDGQAAAAPGTPTFSPGTGVAGNSITITGANLDSTTNVDFNGTSATFTITATNTLTATVPAGATAGVIHVKTLGGTGTSATSFTIGAGTPVDLALSKNHSGNFTQGDAADVYSITVTNLGGSSSTGTVSVVDTLPAGLTATAMSGSGWTINLGTLTASRSDAIGANSTYPQITVTVSVATNASALVTNTATVSGGGETNTANDTASNPTIINAASAPSVNTGAASGVGTNSATLNATVDPNNQTATAQFQYGLTTNYGSVATIAGTLSGSTTQAVSASISGLASSTVYHFRCTATNVLGLTVGSDSTFTTTTPPPPDFIIVKSHAGNFTQGDAADTYTIVVTNGGGSASSGAVTVTDILPAGLTATAISGTGWTTNLATLTATRADALAAGASYPSIIVTVSVATNASALVTNVATVSGGGETNTANDTASNSTIINPAGGPSVTTGAASGVTTNAATLNGNVAANNQTTFASFQYGLTTSYGSIANVTGSFSGTTTQAVSVNLSGLITNTLYHFRAIATNALGITLGADQTFTTTAPAAADITLLKSHLGNFTQGDTGDIYTIVVTNIGGTASSGSITVTESLPAGLTATAISGSGWTTSLGSLTASRTNALAPGAAYPAIIVTVSVATNAPASVTNTATVSGGNDGNVANNTASDITTINVATGGAPFTGTLVGWDTSTVSNYGVSPFTPTVTGSNVAVTAGLTRGAGVFTNTSGALRGWGGVSFTNGSSAAAIAAGQFVTFSVTASNGYKASYSSISRFDYRRSGTGASSGLVQFQLGAGAFIDITNIAYTVSASTGGSIGAIDLSGISALQNVGAGTNVTFRIVNWAGTSSAGTWYIFDVGTNSNPDLSIDGTIAPVVASTPPTITSQPDSVTNLAGTTAGFSVSASGTAPLAYQWLKAGGSLSGATNSSLSLPGVGTNDAADYQVIITNTAGAVTSSVATLTVLLPPTVSDPASLTNIAGSTALFSVTADGTAPLAYQWLKDGAPIDGATDSSLSLVDVQTNDAASYQIIVTNTAGAITSSVATLTVLLPPTVSDPASLTNVAGTTALFSVSAGGSAPLSYQWLKNGGAIGGATSSGLSLPNVQSGDVASYQVIVANAAGSVTSSVASLTVLFPPTVTDPQSVTNFLGDATLFSVTAGGTSPLSYQWVKDGSPISGATFSIYSIDDVESAAAGSYQVIVTNEVGAVTSSVATLTIVAAPSIDQDPTGLTNLIGSTAVFTVVAEGTATLTYQWQKDGVVLTNNTVVSGATSNVLTLTNISASDAADYTAVVANDYGTVTSAVATLTILLPPSVTTPPASQSVLVGSNASFNVAVTGSAPFNYQWLKNGSVIGGANTDTLSLLNVQTNDAAGYSVIITNAAGSVTSSVATLTLLSAGPPVIISQPFSGGVNPGAMAAFGVGVTSALPVGYSWFKDGTNLVNGGNISGAKSAVVVLNSAQTADQGSYQVVITNASGAVTSSVATLTVTSVTDPTVAITAPANNAAVTTYTVALTGTAHASHLVSRVQIVLNGGDAGTTYAALNQSNSTSVTWSRNLSLLPGTNIVEVFSQDFSNHSSAVVTRRIILNAPATLTVNKVGSGTLSPDRSGVVLALGKAYTMTAVPNPGNVFSNWLQTVDGITTVATENAKLTFIMSSNLVLTANFATNRFLTAAGSYNGLFWDTNNGVALPSSGFLKVTLTKPSTKPSAFSGTLKADGNTLTFSGSFNVHGDGVTTKAIARKGRGSLTVRLHLPFDGSATLSGTVSNDNVYASNLVSGDSVWLATYRGDLATFNSATNPAAAHTNTIVIPGSVDSAAAPGGDGYGYVRIATSGNVSVAGALGDGAALAQTVPISRNGDWPFFAMLYSGPHTYTNGASVLVNTEFHGEIIGWLSVTNSGVSGTVQWIKSPMPADPFYPAGFAVEGDLQSSPYSIPATGVRLVAITNGTIQLFSGNLSGVLSNGVALSTANVFTFPPTNRYGLMLGVMSKASGILSGTFKNPANGNINTAFKGIVLQSDGTAHGFFKGTNQTGGFLIQGN